MCSYSSFLSKYYFQYTLFYGFCEILFSFYHFYPVDKLNTVLELYLMLYLLGRTYVVQQLSHGLCAVMFRP